MDIIAEDLKAQDREGDEEALELGIQSLWRLLMAVASAKPSLRFTERGKWGESFAHLLPS